MVERKEVDGPRIPPLLIDTNWIIDALNGVAPALGAISRNIPAGIGLSIVSLGELYDGVAHGRDDDPRLAALRTYLTIYDVVALS